MNKKMNIIYLLLIIILIFLIIIFFNTNKKDNKINNFENSTNEDNNKKEYKLRDGEIYIKNTSTDHILTKYDGAYYIDGVMIVNKSYPLDSNYTPTNPYKEITSDYLYGGDYIESNVMEAFIKMRDDAAKLGYSLKITSGYRSYNVQVELYNNYVLRDGQEAADTYSARAGYSEHQSGLCFDLNGTNSNFLETKTGKWVNDNAYKYGFVLRFPRNKETYTGYAYEAWHYRYVGVDLATILYNNGDWVSLEEYFDIDSKYSK